MEGPGPHGLGFRTYTTPLVLQSIIKAGLRASPESGAGKTGGAAIDPGDVSDVGQSPGGSGRAAVLEIFKGNPLGVD